MDFINKINGAVLFIDILGIGALTQNQIALKKKDFAPWLDYYGLEYNNQHLAAAILSEFREELDKLQKEFLDVKFAQLSDCAFIWSENVSNVVMITSRLMNACLNKGILCRGGMSYGEIIETTQNLSLGKFIVGDAVSKAVKLEPLFKGARILVDPGFPLNFWSYDNTFRQKLDQLFVPFINPLDYETYDEFKWYLVQDLTGQIEDLAFMSVPERITLTKNRLKLANKVRYSPRYNWNSSNSHGKVQLKATVNFLAENNLLGIHHNFEWQNIGEKRDKKIVDSINNKIDSYSQFYLYKHIEPPEFEE
jgi:hypothetical protein